MQLPSASSGGGGGNGGSMYPSPAAAAAAAAAAGGIARYGSAPGSLLASIAESVIGGGGSEGMMTRFFSGDSSCLTAESSCKESPDLDPFRTKDACGAGGGGGGLGLQRSYGFGDISAGNLSASAAVVGESSKDGGSQSHPLIRQSSSPAGFFSHLMVDNGFPVSRGIESYCSAGMDGFHGMANRRLQSQLSFSRQDSLSQISETSIPEIGESMGSRKNFDEAAGQSYISSNFPMGSWEDTNSIVFSAPSSKRGKSNNGDMITNLCNLDSQFSLPKNSLDMDPVEKLLQIQQDSVAFKIRAKRGCATHPRSIAERERRTRISEKLRKLQELVPNMDKQTNTADMLDLAVQHIKGLQNQVQKLDEERTKCTCTSKQEAM